MKTVEVVEAMEHTNDKNDRICNYLERFVCWVLITISVAFLLAVTYEMRETMHIHNRELRERIIMRNAYRTPLLRHQHEYFMP